jgi:hypothetical protein
VVSYRSGLTFQDASGYARMLCWRAIAAALPEGDPRVQAATQAADAHLRAGMEGCDSGENVGDHWLATFAVLALTT